MTILQFQPPVIAHRGASSYAPENTMTAFTKAIQLGVKWIEFDVTLSADDVPVIFHDDKLERTTDGKGYIWSHPYSVLAKLDAGSWFDPMYSSERIPTLLEVLEFLGNYGVAANIELKSQPGHEEKLVKRILQDMAKLKSSPMPEQLLFSSFSIDALRYLRKYAPERQLGLLQHEWHHEWRSICTQLGCVSINVNKKILTPDFADEIKNMNMFLLVYTVNDPARARELYSMGVDAVFSDNPDII